MAKLTVKDVDLKGKKVLVRVDFNVPVKDGVITNDNRITAALPTIKYILEQGGRAILFSHLGRVKEEADKAGKSLAPVAADLAAKLGQDVAFLPGVTRGAELEAAINALEDGQVLLVENTRYEDVDGKKESKNDPELGKYWASLGDGIFVNDAFGTAHRAHASNVGISANVEKAVAGFLLEKANGKLILPVDSKEANAFADYTEVKDTEGEAVDPGFLGLDIGPKSIAKFDEALTGAKTVVWNGPMGVFENPDFQAGTIGVMDAIVKQPGVKSIIGGGDSAAAAINLGRADKFSWISTGGGASMELLEGKVLPGLAALTEK